MPFELRPHQEVAVGKMHNGCILCGGVGVGKTHTSVQYYLNNEAPKPVYVITTAKKRDKGDWQDVWAEVGMHKDKELTLGSTVLVDSWENIKKYEEVENAFFIFDEQRLVGTGAWVKAFYKISQANRWIMLSATPGDNWLDYVPVFRANGFVKNITQFKEDFVVQRWTGRYYQVIGYRQVPKLVRWRNQLLVDMPYDKHTTRHTHEVAVSYDEELVRRLVKDRWHVYEDRPLTDASELFRVMRKVVYSDESRLRAVQSLLTTHPKLIVFYNFDYELEILRTLAQEGSLSTDFMSRNTDSMPSAEALSGATDWNYLLSPEGLRENASLTSSTLTENESPTTQTVQDRWGNTHSLLQTDGTSTRSHYPCTSPEASSEQAGHWTTDTGSGEVWIPQTCPTKTALTSGSSSTPTTSSTESTAISAELTDLFSKTQRVIPESSLGTSQTLRTDHGQSHSSEPSSQIFSSKRGSLQTRTGLSTRPPSRLKSSGTSTSTSLSTQEISSKSQSDGHSMESSHSPSESKSSQTDLVSPERTAECPEKSQTDSPRESTARSTKSERQIATMRINDAIERRDAYLKKMSGSKSSTKSRSSQVTSQTPSDSTSSQPFAVAEWNGHKHEEIPTTTSWVYLVQYVAGAEAWECVETDAIAFWSMPYSYKLWWQSHGRIDRLNTAYTDLHYYVLMSKAIIDRGVKKSLAAKKSFNESAFGAKMGWNGTS